jgi:glyoxylase-like metal-dependent hydrolase (beta-lactamase superfamily II)
VTFAGGAIALKLAAMRTSLLRTFGLLLSTLFLAAAAARAAPLHPEKLSPHVYLVQGESALGSKENRNFISNAAILVGPEGVVLFDALGSPALARELVETVKTLTDKPITHVIVSHYHADHVYGLQVFKDLGATIVAHQLGREYLYSETATQRLKAGIDAGLIEPGTRLVPADVWIDKETKLHAAGLDLVITPVGPAHTPEDIAVWLASDQLILAGDIVFRGRVPYVGQADSARWIASLDKLLAWPVKILVPGHGPASTDARTDMLQTRDYLAYLRATMGRAARDMTPFEEAYAATDWSAYEKLPLFKVANRMNAYNTYLLMEATEK